MERISGLTDDLLVKILSFVPTKVAVSTSILSKRWEFLWMWVPKLEYDVYEDVLRSSWCTAFNHSMPSFLRYLDFIAKNLPLHKAPIIDSLRLNFGSGSYQLDEDIKQWVGIAVSRCVRELRIDYCSFDERPDVVLPSSLYTCKSLVMMKLRGVLVDVPPTVCLPSLKTLQLRYVRYFSEDSLRLLLSYCPVLEDLVIERHGDDNVEALVVIVPSLQRLSVWMHKDCSDDRSVIDTPSLKYLRVVDQRYSSSYLIKHMPKLEEADITVREGINELLESITSVKRLSLEVASDEEEEEEEEDDEDDEESEYCDGIVFHQLEHLNLRICCDYWSKFLVSLLNDSPKLRVLNLFVDSRYDELQECEHEQINWSNEGSLIPECLLKTLETFEFAGCKGRLEERDFLSFFFKNARCLKSTSILHSSCD